MEYVLFLQKETDLFDVKVYVRSSETDNAVFLIRIDVLSRLEKNEIVNVNYMPSVAYVSSVYPLFQILQIDNGRSLTNILCVHNFKNLSLFEKFYLEKPLEIKIRYKVDVTNNEEHIEVITLNKY